MAGLPYNNPAFQLFLMATVEAYKLAWPAREKEMLLVSIGTGADPKANANLAPNQMNLVYSATSIPSALMYAASVEQDLLCRVFGKCLVGEPISIARSTTSSTNAISTKASLAARDLAKSSSPICGSMPSFRGTV